MGLNYRHGTGHGVGAALNVHEGPQSIASRFWNTQPLLEHMVCSNEPGYYEVRRRYSSGTAMVLQRYQSTFVARRS
jgi:Xaa-Pro aminopeptidase